MSRERGGEGNIGASCAAGLRDSIQIGTSVFCMIKIPNLKAFSPIPPPFAILPRRGGEKRRKRRHQVFLTLSPLLPFPSPSMGSQNFGDTLLPPLFPFFLYPIDRLKTSFSFQDPISPLSPSPLVYFDPPPPFPLLLCHRLVLHDGRKKRAWPEVLEWGGNVFVLGGRVVAPKCTILSLVGQVLH